MTPIFLLFLADSSMVQKSPTKAVVLSLLIPGGGQFYTGNYIKGIIIGGIEILFGYLAYNEHLLAEKSNETYHIEKRNRYLWYMGGTILYSMADAYISAHFYRYKEIEKIEPEEEKEKIDK